MQRQRLSQRMGKAQPDGPHEGIPDHIVGGIEYWFEGICGHRTSSMGSGAWQEARMREAAAVIRSDAGIRNARAGLMRELLNEGAVDHEVFIDLIDAALGV
jgi:hypothetical protein